MGRRYQYYGPQPAYVVVHDDRWPEHDDELRVTATEARGLETKPEHPGLSDEENAERRFWALEREAIIREARGLLESRGRAAAVANGEEASCDA
jgi:hypothetical protein